MRRIPWFDITLRCTDCGKRTYRPARGNRVCDWCGGQLKTVMRA